MRVDVLPELPPDLMDEAWQFYCETFTPLVTRAITRHLMVRAEFDVTMADRRVLKFVTRDHDGLTGLSVMTDDLDAVPLISPPFFQHHWPQPYAERRIIYCVFIAARHGARGEGVFVALQRHIYARMVEPVRGIVVLDICLWNERERNLPWAVEDILSGITGEAKATRVDTQSYWLYEFPAAS